MKMMVPVHSGNLLSGGKGMRILAHITEKVENLLYLISPEEIVS